MSRYSEKSTLTPLNSINRRNFIKTTLVGITGWSLMQSCNLEYTFSWRVLTLEEGELLDALVEQIIPTDEWPGARDAGVTNYIDQQLAGFLSDLLPQYQISLEKIQQSCKKRFSVNFEELGWDAQTRYLEKMETGKSDPEVWDQDEDKNFFQTLVRHTMQGFYGGARHGGNKKFISYKMLELDYPFIVGQNRYSD